ncbi:filamentous hemagglutinin N-terminal domain-containing protein [Pseudorhodoferax soli]|nr:filamentous hemagglutinin N-terminal domain-containing protein [Pseudorhodoferax soli]
MAAPAGGVVVGGDAAIAQSGSVTNVQQSSQRAAINWQNFSVGANETVNFLQPNASAVVLNRVVGNERSVIDGAMNANGQVFLVNSAGILFGKGSSVNVGGLVASTRPISDTDFLAGRNVFGGGGTASVVNQGRLTAADGGYIALLGASVSNQGVVTATKGTVALAAGDQITLNFSGNSLLGVSIDQGTLDALVENQQAIYADGGTVLLTAKAASALLRSTVNVGGVVQAQTIDDLLGRVEVRAHGGTTSVTGTIDARAIGAGNGGFIETSGDTVKVANSAQILTRAAQGKNGKWLVDPNDYTIAASGGDITGAFLSNYLDTQGDYEVQSVAGAKSGHGDIHVNDAITWGSDNKLTLTAQRDININNAITINGVGGQLALNFGGDYRIRTPASYAGAVLDADGKPVANTDTSGGVYGSVTFSNDANLRGLTINGDVYTLIHSMAQLDALDNTDAVTLAGNYDTVNGNYAIAKNLDAAGVTYATAPVYLFGNGTVTGLGHTISNFTIAPAFDYAGLFGQVLGVAVFRDIGFLDVAITRAVTGVGALVGGARTYGAEIRIYNAYVTGEVQGNWGVGGLAGSGVNTVEYAFSAANVSGFSGVGGLVGGLGSYFNSNLEPFGSGYVSSKLAHAHATGVVTASYSGAGGLAGGLTDTTVDLVYASGNVGGAANLGGLAGELRLSGGLVDATITNSFATGNVTGENNVGGLLGLMSASINNEALAGRKVGVDNVHATGNVTATQGGFAGGLIAQIDVGSWNISRFSNPPEFFVANATASGDVTILGQYTGSSNGTSASSAGGLVGAVRGTRYGANFSNVCCGYGGTISNSSASGTVDVTGSTNSVFAGGLVGTAANTAIIGSSSSSDVIASTAVTVGNGASAGAFGGLVGFGTSSSVDSSYATGSLTGNPERLGGIVGSGWVVIGSNNYYNTATAANGYGDQSNKATTGATDNSQGLTGDQMQDIRYYANGTIGQVLAQRAAEAAAEEARRAAEAAAEEARRAAEAAAAAAEAARVAAEAAAAEAQRAAEAAAAEAQRLAEAAAAEAQRLAEAAAAEARRVAEAAAQEARRIEHAAYVQSGVQTASAAVAQGLEANARPAVTTPQGLRTPAATLDQNIVVTETKRFSANVREIEVDGQKFYLEDDEPNTGMPQ